MLSPTALQERCDKENQGVAAESKGVAGANGVSDGTARGEEPEEGANEKGEQVIYSKVNILGTPPPESINTATGCRGQNITAVELLFQAPLEQTSKQLHGEFLFHSTEFPFNALSLLMTPLRSCDLSPLPGLVEIKLITFIRPVTITASQSVSKSRPSEASDRHMSLICSQLLLSLRCFQLRNDSTLLSVPIGSKIPSGGVHCLPTFTVKVCRTSCLWLIGSSSNL